MKRKVNCLNTSHSAYDATLTESNGVKMDSYIQILCRFQKSERKLPPLSPLSTQKSPFTPVPPKDEKKILWVVKGDF